MKVIHILKTGIQVFIFLISSNLYSQSEWNVPDEAKNTKNPVVINSELYDKGEQLYMQRCKSCHGDPGMHNMIALNPKPRDLFESVVLNQTDGELYYKLQTGKGAMPAFPDAVLAPADKWTVISFIKAYSPDGFSDGTVGVDAEKLTNLKITLTMVDSLKKVTAKVEGVNEAGETVAAAGQKVGFYIKRYFGMLPVVKETMKTTDKGMVSIEMPMEMPGDTAGNYEIIVQLEDKRFSDVKVQQVVNWGTKLVITDFEDQGVMWGNRNMAPWWIVFLYLSILAGVWLTIFYVVFQVYRIYKLGKSAK